MIVIGVGNPYRRDDAAGLEVARRVRAAAPGAEVAEHDGEPTGLLDLWDGADAAVVVDAVRSGAPGTVHRVEAGRRGVPDAPRRDSSHSLGIGDAVRLGQTLDRLPGRLLLVGIAGQDFTAGVGLTPAVARAVGAVTDEILADLGHTAREGDEP